MTIITDKGIFIKVKLSPNSSKNEILEFADGILKVKVTAPPVEGKANKALCDFLARELSIPKSDIIITKGSSSRNKTIFIEKRHEEKIKKILTDGKAKLV